MPNLFQLAESIQLLKGDLDCMVEGGDVTPEEAKQIFQDNIDALQMPLKEKIESLVNWAKNNELDVESLKEQKRKVNEILDKKIKSMEKQIEWTKQYITDGMLYAGIDKIDTEVFKISLKKTASCKVVDEEALKRYVIENGLEDSYIRKKITEEWNITNIKNAIKNGATIDGVAMEIKDGINVR